MNEGRKRTHGGEGNFGLGKEEQDDDDDDDDEFVEDQFIFKYLVSSVRGCYFCFL